jgi:hypothetical protein
MDYEHRYRPKWWQLSLLIFYGVAAVYTVLVSNPYLYSSKQYQEGLAGKKDDGYKPIVTTLSRPEDKSTRTVQRPNRMGDSKQAVDGSGETRDRRYVEMTLTPLFMELEKPGALALRLLDKQVIGILPDGSVWAADYEGKSLWSFSSQEAKSSGFLPEPAADQDSLYLVNRGGRIYNLKLSTGRLYWKAQLDGSFLSDGLIIENHLYLVQQNTEVESGKKTPTSKAYLRKVDRNSGDFAEASTDLNIKSTAELTYDSESKRIFIVSAERLLCVQLPNMEIIWQKSLSSPVIGPAVLADGRVMVSIKEGKFKSFQIANGTEVSEVDVEQPLASAPAYIPLHKRAALTTTDGYQHVIDLNAGKRLWRFDLNNKNKMTESWSARLKGNLIEELQMKWVHKGWTIWSPCVEKRICIYNPEKGQIVGRVMLSGALVTLPYFREKSFHALLEMESGYALGHYVEQPAAKKVAPAPETTEIQ